MKKLPAFVLEPPYALARHLSDVAPGVGSVVLLDAHFARLSTYEVKQAMGIAPWCPVCLLASPDSNMRAVRRLGRTCVVFGLEESGGAMGILRAVATRPRPAAAELGEWVARRARLTGTCRFLTEIALRPTMRPESVRYTSATERECLQRLGDWSALQWQQALQLAEIAADRPTLRRFMTSQSHADGVLRHQIPALLGVTPQRFEELFGWEWVLESALRQCGFFERATGIRRLVPHPTPVWATRVSDEVYSASA